MFKKHWLSSSIISAILFSVAALAAPIDTSHFNVMVPVTITELSEDSAMTHVDFIEVMPYVVDLAVTTPVPIMVSPVLFISNVVITEDVYSEEMIDQLILEVVQATDLKFVNQATDLKFVNHAVMRNLNFERSYNDLTL